jgi:hypothetical protein
MTPQTKYILQQGIEVFLASTDTKKEELILFNRNNISNHYKALNTIGIGYLHSQVRAGEIFDRIFGGAFKN